MQDLCQGGLRFQLPRFSAVELRLSRYLCRLQLPEEVWLLRQAVLRYSTGYMQVHTHSNGQVRGSLDSPQRL